MVFKTYTSNAGTSGSASPTGNAESFTEGLGTGVGSFTFTGPAGRYSSTNQGVWYPLLANMPGINGARPVVNWFLNSDTPGAPTAWNITTDAVATYAATTDVGPSGQTIGVLTVTNAVSTGAPFFPGYQGTANGAGLVAPYANQQWAATNSWPPGTISAERALVKITTLDTGDFAVYQRFLDNAVGPTEDGSGTGVTWTTTFQTVTSSMESTVSYAGLQIRYPPRVNATGNYEVAQVQLENVSGDTASLWSNEYVPSGAAPTWRWFNYAKGSSRTNSQYTTNQAAIVPQRAAAANTFVLGTLTDAAGATIAGITGVVSEPQAVNIATGFNTLACIGNAKGSGAITAHTGIPFVSGSTTAYLEYPSGMMIGNYNGTAPTDIALTFLGVDATHDSIDSTTTNFITAGFFVNMSIWVWRANTSANGGLWGPMKILSVTATKLGLDNTYFLLTKAAGPAHRIMRIPGNGDNCLLELNDGTWFATTHAAGVAIQAYSATWDPKGAITCTLTAGPPSDGGYASTDHGRRMYFWTDETDFGVSKAGGSTGAYAKVVNDRAGLIAAGLGYMCPMGLVLELYSGTTATEFFTLGGASAAGVGARPTYVSIWNKFISGAAGGANLKLASHANQVVLADSVWTKQSITQTSAGAQNQAQVILGSGRTVRLILWSVEQVAGATDVPLLSSPIPSYSTTATTTRTTTRCYRAWNGTAKNNIVRSLVWTPSQGALSTNAAQKQTLWSLYQDASNYLELSISGTAVTWRKRRNGTNFDVTATLTPVAGTGASFNFASSRSAGLTLTIAGVVATPNTSDLFDISALTPAAVEEIGGLNGASIAYGSFSTLGVT